MTRSPSRPEQSNPIASALADNVRNSAADDVLEPIGSSFIVGVVGGTGSGKTTVSRHIQDAIPPGHIAYMLDMRIFVDTDADVRFIRRLRRDRRERGRTLESIIHQYVHAIRPMHLEFVEPSKRYAHVIVPEGGNNHVAREMIISRIHTVLAARGRH